jgi:3-hydroxybutyryl-CoA dehydrogenase
MRSVGVIGCGLMGAGIAEVSARCGQSVIVVEASEEAVEAGFARLEKSLRRAEAKGKLSAEGGYTEVMGRIEIVTDLEAIADRDIVVEAISEDEGVKVALFEQLDEVIRNPEAILATNTSSIPIMKLGVATSRPQQVIGVHFFNPAPVLGLVEIVPSLLTSSETTERARAWGSRRSPVKTEPASSLMRS